MSQDFTDIKNYLGSEKPRLNKENVLKQKARVIWFTGLSGSGKTTLAVNIELELLRRGFISQIIDGDDVRSKLNYDLGFSENDRKENIRRIAEVSKMFMKCGIITLNSFVSPTREIRKIARQIIGEEDFIEIYVNSPIEVCEKRDVKGLYRKARAGEIKEFTGISAPFEAPVNPFMEVRSDLYSVEECANLILDKISPLIENN